MSRDTDFEKAFSGLAVGYLSSKAPALLDHMIGFQLLDRTDDGRKAAGFAAFSVGDDNLVYAPLVFINRGIRDVGLWIKKANRFKPLKDNWVREILNQSPAALGRTLDRNQRDQGAGADLLQALGQGRKYAALQAAAPEQWEALKHRPQWAQDGILDLADTFTGTPGVLADYIGSRGPKTAAAWTWLAREYPVVGAAARRYYGDRLDQAVKQAQARGRRRPLRKLALLHAPDPVRDGTLDVYVGSTLSSYLYDDAAKAAAWRDGLFIKDARADDAVSTASPLPSESTFRETFEAPRETGLYQVLLAGGRLHRCLVVHRPHGPDGAADGVMFVDLDADGGARPCTVYDKMPTTVVAVPEVDEEDAATAEQEQKPWDRFIGTLDDSVRAGNRYIAVTPAGEVTRPFSVRAALDEGVYQVEFDHGVMTEHGEHCQRRPLHYHAWSHGEFLTRNLPAKAQARSEHGSLDLPQDARFLRLDGDDDGKRPEEVIPGSIPQLLDLLMADRPSLRLRVRGKEAMVGDHDRLSPAAAVAHLVYVHGLRRKAAEDLLAAAAARPGRDYPVLVKYAQSFPRDGVPPGIDLMRSVPVNFPEPASGSMDLLSQSVPTTSPVSSYESLPMDDAPPPDLEGARRQQLEQLMGAAQQASDRGDQEVFDASALSALLKLVGDEAMYDGGLQPLDDAMDLLYRRLMVLYWNSDRFAEAYGKDKVPQLEDAMRSAAESLGDLILDLKQNRAHYDPSLMGAGQGVEQSTNQGEV